MFSNFPTLHPVVVHFPVVLLLLSGVFGFISLFSKNELWKILAIKSLIGGVISSPIAVITGFIEEQKMNHAGVDEMLIVHKYNGLAIVFFFQFLFVWYWFRKLLMGNKEYKLWVMGLLVGNCLVILQGYIGGELVFSKGMGVKPVEESMDSSLGGHHGEGEKKVDDHKMKDMDKPKDPDSKKEILGMDDKKDRHDMKGTDDTKANDIYIINGNFYQYNLKDNGNMKDMKSMQKSNGKDNMKDMDMKDGRDNMKDMDKSNMKESKEMGDMKAKNNRKNMTGMEAMKGMNMNNTMDTFKFKDNNPGRKPKKK
ncbi:MAG: DUF2231 domain-containing protein [Bacteroidetes bacterium]|nr:DUF2231 domain-containing protein [Bacteroidota bacterium]